MKRNLTYLVLTAFILAGCSKSDSEPSPVVPNTPVDVYASGYVFNPSNSATAMTWKNANASTLTTGNNAMALSIFVSGTDVYAVGGEQLGNLYTPRLWKNGIPT